jgi:hypothetical protein
MHHHCLISGTGRAGTTLLVSLLTRLGVQTGFSPERGIAHIARAGLERVRVDAASPYLVKSPFFCEWLDGMLSSDPELVVDCMLVPVRDMKAAAASRAHVQERTTGFRSSAEVVPGGLVDTADPDSQEAVLRRQLSNLIVTLARHDIPLVLLWYPRLATDPRYLYGKLKFLCPQTSFADFERAFLKVVRPDWIHQFSAADIS